jgi:hypothetical protein
MFECDEISRTFGSGVYLLTRTVGVRVFFFSWFLENQLSLWTFCTCMLFYLFFLIGFREYDYFFHNEFFSSQIQHTIVCPTKSLFVFSVMFYRMINALFFKDDFIGMYSYSRFFELENNNKILWLGISPLFLYFFLLYNMYFFFFC